MACVKGKENGREYESRRAVYFPTMQLSIHFHIIVELVTMIREYSENDSW
jgi:hypothetical protein